MRSPQAGFCPTYSTTRILSVPSTQIRTLLSDCESAECVSALEGASGLFGPGSTAKENAPAVDLKTLHAKIGELTLENDFLSGALGKAGLLSAKR